MEQPDHDLPEPSAGAAGEDDDAEPTLECPSDLIRPHVGLVLKVCRKILRGPADIDDAVQETFIKLARNRSQIQSNIVSWLYACARTTALDVARRVRVRDRRATSLDGLEEPQAPEDDEQLADGAKRLDACLENLKPEERALLLSYFFDSKTLDCIADELALSKSAVKKRLDKAIGRLRDQLSADQPPAA
ncbi:MAG TPA: sigma-70 family RNA polymerase sigma factor [Planctomycetota bacterium]|nr:sigma-70 family RNA polymerase sigma factor [Planctomycetota bacterium]